MILMAPCIINFIGANALLGPVGGRGPWTLLAFKWHHIKSELAGTVQFLQFTYLKEKIKLAKLRTTVFPDK
jgi:hypothetical protein